MSDSEALVTRAPIPLLPPGCQFFPTEQQLLRYYLPGKNSVLVDPNTHFDVNVVGEFDVLVHDPVELVGIGEFEYWGVSGRRRHWYCYAPRVLRKPVRRTRGGFWKRKGRIRDVAGNNGDVIGRRTKYVFYCRGFGATCHVLTDWVVYEYALIEEGQAFVLCRAFEKSHKRKDALPADFKVSDASHLHDTSELASMLEHGDFIELDDLLMPLSSTDNEVS